MENKKNFKKRNNNNNKKPNVKQAQAVRAKRQYVKPKEIRAGGEIEYKMPIAMYNDLLKDCKKERGGDAQTYLCNYVNEQLNLLGTCVRVIPG